MQCCQNRVKSSDLSCNLVLVFFFWETGPHVALRGPQLSVAGDDLELLVFPVITGTRPPAPSISVFFEFYFYKICVCVCDYMWVCVCKFNALKSQRGHQLPCSSVRNWAQLLHVPNCWAIFPASQSQCSRLPVLDNSSVTCFFQVCVLSI